MKINWGWGIVAVLVLFMGFILNLVYRCTQQRVDLVAENYYEKEIQYQQQINKERNTADLAEAMQITKSSDQVVIRYPSFPEGSKISGEITFFRPDDAREDFHVPVHPDAQGMQSVSAVKMSRGRWNIQVNWTVNSEDYYTERKLFID